MIRIRTSANSEIGMGHLIRCLALAHMLKELSAITFYLPVEELDELSFFLKDEPFEFEDSGNRDSRFFESLDPNEGVVLDSYEYDLNFQESVRTKSKFLLCIDDIHDREFLADVVLNQAPQVFPDMYRAREYTQFLLGPKYALLRPPFFKERNKEKADQSILLAMGGADPFQLTERYLETLSKTDVFERIVVIAGPAMKKELKIKSREVEIHSSLSATEMVNVMDSCRYALVPSSGISFECISRGVTPWIGTYAENQNALYSSWLSLGVNGVGDLRDIDRVVDEITKDLSCGNITSIAELRRIVDGNSPVRIRKFFERML